MTTDRRLNTRRPVRGRSAGRAASWYEGEIQAALDAEAAFNNVEILVRRHRGGPDVAFTKGSPNLTYTSHSTVKPISAAICLDQVRRGRLALSDLVIDILPGWDTNAVDQQRNITLSHLLSMGSKFTAYPAPGTGCDQVPGQTQPGFATCIDNLPLANSTTNVPGVPMVYSDINLDIFGQMSVVASGLADWAAVRDEWRTLTGLFPNILTYGFFPSGGQQIGYRGAEYLDFMDAVRLGTILTPALCQSMIADQLGTNGGSRSPAYTWYGDDWHMGRMFWVQRREPVTDWADGSDPVDIFSTVGVGGQYQFSDQRLGYSYILSATFATDALSVSFTNSIMPLLRGWAVA